MRVLRSLRRSGPTDIGPSALDVPAGTSRSGLGGEGAGAEDVPDCTIGHSDTMYDPCIAEPPAPTVGAILTAM